jgi:hypothetical protein
MEKHYIGSCPHDIPKEWYDTDDSTYTVLDSSSGAYVNVTTCEECRRKAEAENRIIAEEDIPFEEFNIPFENAEPTGKVTVFDSEGKSQVIDFDEENNE